MIRPAHIEETDTLVAIADRTGAFKPIELDTLRGVLDDHHEQECDPRDRAIVIEHEGSVIGFAYFGPTDMTDRSWHLYWIFVDRTRQARGIGATLMQCVEKTIRECGGRLVVIETSGLASYEPTHRFYRKLGYRQTATVPDFYADGDDLVFFTKRVGPISDASPHFVLDAVTANGVGQLAAY